MKQETILTTATGIDYRIFGNVRDLRKRKGFTDALQDRYRVIGDGAGVEIHEPHQHTSYYLRQRPKFAVFPGRRTFVVFDPADLVKTEIIDPSRIDYGIYDNGPISDDIWWNL